MSSETERKESFSINVQNVSRQMKVRAAGVSPDMTVGELVRGLIPKMGLPQTDPVGRPVSYHVHSDREGRHLHASEEVGNVLQPEDLIVLQPNIQAG